LGTGTDTKSAWMLLVTVICLAAVVCAVLVRIGRSAPAAPGLRTGTTILAVATPIGLAVFALAGPLQKGWARRAGTPAPRSAAASAARRTSSATTVASRAVSPRPGPLDRPFSATLFGTVTQSNQANGAVIELDLRLGGTVTGRMRIRLGGEPLDEGGLSLTGSQVDVTGPGMPSAMVGKVVSLSGEEIVAHVTDLSRTNVALRANVSIDQSSEKVTGSLTGQPLGTGP